MPPTDQPDDLGLLLGFCGYYPGQLRLTGIADSRELPEIKEGSTMSKWTTSIEKLTEVFDRIRHAGIEEGLRRFAWSKDGIEYVGTGSTTLAKALSDLDVECVVDCPHSSRREVDGVECCSRCGVGLVRRGVPRV